MVTAISELSSDIINLFLRNAGCVNSRRTPDPRCHAACHFLHFPLPQAWPAPWSPWLSYHCLPSYHTWPSVAYTSLLPRFSVAEDLTSPLCQAALPFLGLPTSHTSLYSVSCFLFIPLYPLPLHMNFWAMPVIPFIPLLRFHWSHTWPFVPFCPSVPLPTGGGEYILPPRRLIH